MPEDHFTSDADIPKGPLSVADARRAHHLASADPELDGTMTGPEHDAKYALERAAGSRADWANAHDGDPDGGRDSGGLRVVDPPALETTAAPAPAAPVEAASATTPVA